MRLGLGGKRRKLLQVCVASSHLGRALAQDARELQHHHLEQHEQGSLVQAPHRQLSQRRRPLLLLVSHRLRGEVRHDVCLALWKVVPVRTGREQQDARAGSSRHAADGVDCGERAGTRRGDEEVPAGGGWRRDVANAVRGEAKVREAHAERAHHEALPPDAVHEHAAPARGRGRELGHEDGARRWVRRGRGEDRGDLGADGGCCCVTAAHGRRACLIRSEAPAEDLVKLGLLVVVPAKHVDGNLGMGI
jgi:hypothetical protein